MTHSRILVSSATGSADTYNSSTDGSLRHAGLARYIVPQSPVRVVRGLPVDVFFTAPGPRNTTLDVGIEYKTIWDVLTCINSGRFADNQLPALRDCDIGILLVEGLIQRGSDEIGGRLQVHGSPLGKERGWYDTAEWGRGSRVWTYTEFEHWYFSMMFRGGVYVPPLTRNKYDSGRFVGSLWRAMTDKAWEEHRAHLATSKAHLAPLRGDLPFFPRAISEASAIGPEGVKAAERTFGSMYAAANASVDEWAGMVIGGGVAKGGRKKKAHKLGRVRAQQVWDEMRQDTRKR